MTNNTNQVNNTNNKQAEETMKAIRSLQVTSAREAVVIAAKGDKVVSYPFSYYLKLEEQTRFDIHEAPETFSRFNAVLACTEVIVNLEPATFMVGDIEMVSHAFIPVFMPDIIFNQLEQSKYWSQKFKAMGASENALAAFEQRAPRKLKFILDGKKRISSEEIMLWEALREEIAKKPFVSIAPISKAASFFKKDEIRKNMTAAAVAKTWSQLQEMGASVARFNTQGQWEEEVTEDEAYEQALLEMAKEEAQENVLQA